MQIRSHLKTKKETDDTVDSDKLDDIRPDADNDDGNDKVDDFGFVNRYKTEYMQAHSDIRHHVMHKHHKHHLHRHPLEDNQNLLYRVTKYSDEIANGDSADDKDLHEEHDMNDAVVDYNGGTNRGYGSAVPTTYFAGNVINGPLFSDHFGTVPRTDDFAQLGDYTVNRYSDELANGDSADDKDLHEEEDTNDDIVDYNGSTNRGYGSAVPTAFFAGNIINSAVLGDHFGTVPRID
jgi:hypothetical protein